MSSEHLAPPQRIAGEDRSSVGRADSYADSNTTAPAGGGGGGGNYPPYIPPATGSATALAPSIPSTPVGAYATPPAGETTPFVAPAMHPGGPGSKEGFATGAYPYQRPRPWYSPRRPWIWLLGFLVLAAVVLVVVLPVWFVAVKPHRHGSGSSRAGGGSSGDGNPGAAGGGGGVDGATWGGNGSEVVMNNGSTFTYINNFGGYCEWLRVCFGGGYAAHSSLAHPYA